MVKPKSLVTSFQEFVGSGPGRFELPNANLESIQGLIRIFAIVSFRNLPSKAGKKILSSFLLCFLLLRAFFSSFFLYPKMADLPFV